MFCPCAEIRADPTDAYCLNCRYASELTAYHHGEVSLHNAVIQMAQDFVGANNIPLLLPMGQYGTRLRGGHDAASPRYGASKAWSTNLMNANDGTDPLQRRFYRLPNAANVE